MSICHRIFGAALAGGSLLLVWWIVGLASGPEYFAFVQNIMTSLLGQLVLFGSRRLCFIALQRHPPSVLGFWLWAQY